MDSRIIEARKTLERLMKASRKYTKLDRCLWCGKKITRFCDSHTIPQLVLRNIAVDGKLDYYNSFMKNPLENMDQGMAETAVFKLICHECDNTLFQKYEDEKNLRELPTEQMLTLIALKNTLFFLNKRLFEIEFNNQMLRNNYEVDCYSLRQTVNRLDIRDYLWEFDRIWEMMKYDQNHYRLISWDRVDYKTPVAYQGQFAVYGDRNGNIVTDIYDHSLSRINKRMHLCVFPLTDCSVVFTFYHEDDHEYDEFADQIRNMEIIERLSFLGYILFFMAEDMAIAKKFPHRTYFMERAKAMFPDSYQFYTNSKGEAEYLMLRNRNIFRRWTKDSFPGILTEKYAIRQ